MTNPLPPVWAAFLAEREERRHSPLSQPAPPVQGGEAAAIEHAECCICFEPLCESPVCVLLGTDAKRVCQHYFHFDCLKDLRPYNATGYANNVQHTNNANGRCGLACPMCRADFDLMAKMPDPAENPQGWFRLVDADNTGWLSKHNVREVIRATCNVDEGQLDALLEEQWDTWDTTRSGGITPEELPNLVRFVRQNLPGATAGGLERQGTSDPIMGLSHNPAAWFNSYDADLDGQLSYDEFVRGVIKSVECVDASPRAVQDLKELMLDVWQALYGRGTASLNRAMFTCEGGLASILSPLLLEFSRVHAEPATREHAAALGSGSNLPDSLPAEVTCGMCDESVSMEHAEYHHEIGIWQCRSCLGMGNMTHPHNPHRDSLTRSQRVVPPVVCVTCGQSLPRGGATRLALDPGNDVWQCLQCQSVERMATPPVAQRVSCRRCHNTFARSDFHSEEWVCINCAQAAARSEERERRQARQEECQCVIA